MTTHKVPAITPWGVPDTINVIADGIVAYTTPSHGGMWLDLGRLRQMPETLRNVKTFAGPGWYEEDVDATLVVLAFPEAFDDTALRAATMICGCGTCWASSGTVQQWLFASSEAAPIRARLDAKATA